MQLISINTYASGLRRLGAFIIDAIVISVVMSILFSFTLGWGLFEERDIFFYPYHHWRLLGFFSYHSLIREIIFISYYALMESSKYQGTLGKIALGMKVVDKNGMRIDLSKAILRNLSKILSALILGIGYFMIIFDDRKQGLHDKIADTFVVKR